MAAPTILVGSVGGLSGFYGLGEGAGGLLLFTAENSSFLFYQEQDFSKLKGDL